MATKVRGSQVGFLAVTFLLVGLVGVFATYATPVPFIRGLRLERTLSAALATANAHDPRAALEALRPALGDEASLVIDGSGSLAERVAKARADVEVRFVAEGLAEAARIRLLVIVMTIMCAVFGIATLGFGGDKT